MHTFRVKDHYAGDKLTDVRVMGLVFAANVSPELIRALESAGADKVRDWSNKGARIKNAYRICLDAGYSIESRLDAAHGFRYVCAVYPARDKESRRVALAAAHGMRNTNPELTF